MKSILKLTFLVLVIHTVMACGVYSHMRPADTLDPGAVDVSAGISANNVEGAMFVANAAVGLSPRFELYGHYETYSGWGGLRFSLLKSESSPVALSAGFQMGSMARVENGDGGLFDIEYNRIFGYGPSLVLGKKIGKLEPYIGYVAIFGDGRMEMGSAKGGLRIHLTPLWILGFELGSAQHFTKQNGVFGTFEGAGYLTFHFPGGKKTAPSKGEKVKAKS